MKLVFESFEDKYQQAQIVELLTPLLRFFPSWAAYCVVSDNTDSENVAKICLRPRQRDCTLMICPSFYQKSPYEKQLTLAHEIAHATTGELIEWVDNRLLPLVAKEGSTLRHVLEQEYTDRVEHVAEDLAHIYMELINGNPSTD